MSAARLSRVVRHVNRRRIEKNFHGDEFHQLQILFVEKGIINYASWNDDTTRNFINNSTDENLHELSLEVVATLVRNLFRGKTGDDDEEALIRLIRWISNDTMEALFLIPGLGEEDFRKEIHGKQRDDFDFFVREKRG